MKTFKEFLSIKEKLPSGFHDTEPEEEHGIGPEREEGETRHRLKRRRCPKCGKKMSGESCPVCGY